MPWRDKSREEQRKQFIDEVMAEEENITSLSGKYGISRKTAYKWIERYYAGEELSDRSRRPHNTPTKTPQEMEQKLLNIRKQHPIWGPRKLKRVLENQGEICVPAVSTCEEILKRNGRIDPSESIKHKPYIRFERASPNELWQTDFKGDFLMTNGARCYPLTVLDDCTRYMLGIYAKPNVEGVGVVDSFTCLFKAYGLPEMILCDNGTPWGTAHRGGFTRLEVWLLKLGIWPIHCRAFHPQTQGKDERFHRTLKHELLLMQPFVDLVDAQAHLDFFRKEYNEIRPHEAIDLDVPASRYTPSPRIFPENIPEASYPSEAFVRKVSQHGYFSFHNQAYFLSESFWGEEVALWQTAEDTFSILFFGFSIATFSPHDVHSIHRSISRI